MSNVCFAWRGPKGSGKRGQLLQFLEKQAEIHDIVFKIKNSVYFLDKPEEEEKNGKSIPYEESLIHLGFDVAKMSMSDKSFIQSILTRWSGNSDIFLSEKGLSARFLVLYHAHYLSDDSVIQIHEILEKYSDFSVLFTTEVPVCSRISDFFIEIPVAGKNHLLHTFVCDQNLSIKENVWKIFFNKSFDDWSKISDAYERVKKVRKWVYFCLQRNLRWIDLIHYWIETIYTTRDIKEENKKEIYDILWKFSAGSGWTLINTYRIPIMWENLNLKLAYIFFIYFKKP